MDLLMLVVYMWVWILDGGTFLVHEKELIELF